MFSADKKSTPKKDRYKRDNKAVHNLLLQIAELRQHNVNCMAFVVRYQTLITFVTETECDADWHLANRPTRRLDEL